MEQGGGGGMEREGKGWRGRGVLPHSNLPTQASLSISAGLGAVHQDGEGKSMEDVPFRMIFPSSINACGTVARCAFTFSCPLPCPPLPPPETREQKPH